MQAMALKSGPRNLSFDVLRSEEDQNHVEPLIARKKKKKRSRKKRSVGKLIEGMLTVSHQGGAGIGNLDGFEVGGKGKIGDLGGFEVDGRGKIGNLGSFEAGERGKMVNLDDFEMGEKGRIENVKSFEVEGRSKIGNLGVFEEGERGKTVNLDGFEVGGKGKVENSEGFVVEGRGKFGNLGGFWVGGRDKNGNLDGFEEGRETWSGNNRVGKFGGELRQRNVDLSGGSEEISSLGLVVEENGKEESNSSCGSNKNIELMNRRKLVNEVSLDSNNVMANDRRCK